MRIYERSSDKGVCDLCGDVIAGYESHEFIRVEGEHYTRVAHRECFNLREERTMYQVGDRVKVRKELKEGDEFGRFSVTKSMASFAGLGVTIGRVMISQVPRKGIYRISQLEYNHAWTDEMFEGKENVDV